MSKDEALRIAMEALEVANSLVDGYYLEKGKAWLPEIEEAIAAIKVALEAKDEPVACVIDGDLYFHHEIDWEDLAYQGHGIELLYTTPPQRKPLTDEEIYTEARNHEKFAKDGREWFDRGSFARAIEAAHGIKGKA
jgi:hypothetical protein